MDVGVTDMFATKGVEYLIVIGYLVVLVGLWRLLRPPAPAKPLEGRLVGGWFVLPDGYCFHQGHSWAMPEEGDVVRIGMDDFAQRLLGPLSAIELPVVGTWLSQGDQAWKVKVGLSSVAMLSPVDGEVVAANAAVLDAPDILCSEPYGDGWILKVRVPDRERNQRNLLCGDLASAWMEEQLRTVRTELGLAIPDATTRDGCDGFLRAAVPQGWETLAGRLLLTEH
jgi:glycine cleavage system H lipoate-binding protein